MLFHVFNRLVANFTFLQRHVEANVRHGMSDNSSWIHRCCIWKVGASNDLSQCALKFQTSLQTYVGINRSNACYLNDVPWRCAAGKRPEFDAFYHTCRRWMVRYYLKSFLWIMKLIIFVISVRRTKTYFWLQFLTSHESLDELYSSVPTSYYEMPIVLRKLHTWMRKCDFSDAVQIYIQIWGQTHSDTRKLLH